MSDTNEYILEKILAFAEEDKLKGLENDIAKKNKIVLVAVSKIKTEIAVLNGKLQLIKNKKEKYIDSLISNKFSSLERKTINEKIEEFTLEEKAL